MKTVFVKDLMIPIRQYPSVGPDATLYDAFVSLEAARQEMGRDFEPPRAVLVVDNQDAIIGKLGHWALLKALEPKYGLISEMDILKQANLNNEFIQSIMDNYNFWGEDLYDICARSKRILVKDVMHPVSESIDKDATLADAMHRILIYNTLSMLVKEGARIIGIIRLSDIYIHIAALVKKSDQNTNSSGGIDG
jgi:CBS domain-containing protein